MARRLDADKRKAPTGIEAGQRQAGSAVAERVRYVPKEAAGVSGEGGGPDVVSST